uniref:BspA family leucine-rich repeat surface protein n=1 Tax=Flagellimonas onchidii TaxID=2562684 RepID=UPI0010A681C5
NIVVQISDGELTADIGVAITVKNIVETLAEDPNSFVTTWETTMANEKIAIGIDPNYTYDFTVDWGDGTVEQRSISEKSNFIHIYEDSGVHTVAIYGDFPAIKMTGVNVELRAKLKSIEQWGAIQWQSMNSAFRLCTSMVYNVTGANKPNMSLVTNMSRMFQDCTLFDGNLNDWNTANVIDMERMFSGASNFNGDLSNWNTEKVTTMQNMFSGAEFFTGQGLETWNTENVINMSQMFYSADNFNGDLSNWNTEKVTNMNTMFAGAYKFQGNLSEWNVLNVTDIDGMFKNSGMSDENYSATLVGWATLNQGETQIPQGLDFSDQQGMGYCQNIQGVLEARQALLDLNWNIEGDEPVNCPD